MGVFATILTETVSRLAGDSVWGKIVQTFMKPVADYCFRDIRAKAQRPLKELELEFYEKTKAVDFEYMRKMEELRRQVRFEQATLDWRRRLQEAQQHYLQQNGKGAIQSDNQNVWPLTGHLASAVVANGQSLKPTIFLTRPRSDIALGRLFDSMGDMVSSFLVPYTRSGDYTSRFGAWKEGFDADENIRAVCFMQQGEPALVLSPRMNNAGQVHFRFASWGVGQEELMPAFDNFASFPYDEFRGSVWRDLVISRQNNRLEYGEPSEVMKSSFKLLEADKSVIGNRTDEEALRVLAQRWRHVEPDPKSINDLRSRMSAIIGGVLGIQTALRLDIYNLVERRIAPKLPLAFEEYLRSSSRFLGGGTLDLPSEISGSYCAALRQLAYLGYGPSLFLTVARSLSGYRNTASQLLCEGIGVWACEKGISGVTETPGNLTAAVRLVHDNAKNGDSAFVKDVEETVKALDGDEKLSNRAPRVAVVAPTSGLEVKSIANSRKAGESLVLTIKGVKVEFRWCPPGTFMMGSPLDEKGRGDDETQHQVTLSQGFWMAATLTKADLWQAVMGKNGFFRRIWENDWGLALGVSWNDCKDFVSKIQQYAPSDMIFQLPSEAQWEYACRAGTTGMYNVVGEKLNRLAVYKKSGLLVEITKSVLTCGIWEEDHVGPYAVATKNPNAWGLFDMHGNLWEWCEDWYGNYPIGAVTDPMGAASGSNRVLRGGSGYSRSKDCRSATRGSNKPELGKGSPYGFRIIMINKQSPN